MFQILFICFYVLLALLVFIYYQKKTNAICKSKKRLDGCTTIVTGGTAGMGLEISTDFASRGARVIIACPFKDEGIAAQKQIKEKTGNQNVVFKYLDLGSLKSVREFANDVLNTEDRLDILINNAGVGIPGDFHTADGMSFIMQVNYYGHFLLTILLLPLLIKTGTISNSKSRVVNLTSVLRYISSFEVDNYDKVGYYWSKIRIYGNSKLSFILFSRELTKRLGSHNVVVNNADPGVVATRIFESCNLVVGHILKILINIFFKNAFEGAQTAIHVALDEKSELVSGKIFENCEMINSKLCDSTDIAQRLWERSVELVKLQDHEMSSLIAL